MFQAIKEIFITFIALYMMVTFSGILQTADYIFVEKINNNAPSCIVSNSGEKPCICSCLKETARECCCCSVEDNPTAQSTSQYIIIKGNCSTLPTFQSTSIALKFVESLKTNYLLYPTESIYASEKQQFKQDFNPSIDHPPSIFSS